MFVGDHQRGEFREPAKWLAQRGAELASGISEAISAFRDGCCPALIIVAQSWPGHYSSREIGQLRRAAPLARFVSLLGSWLEGEARTGKPWPSVQRNYWHRWSSRNMDDTRHLLRPATATDDDRLLASLAVKCGGEPEDANRVIGICATNRETADSLADLCGQRGWSSLWVGSDRQSAPIGVDLLLLDVAQASDREIQRVAALKLSLPTTPILALVGFPRSETVDRFLAAGAASVVSKPFLVADLIWQIDALLQPQATSTP
jgi:CheY-like chemotaxis protein